jgi:AraC-like DNA-binding protein
MLCSIQFLFGQCVPRCEHRIDKHFDYYVLQYMEAGAVELDIGEKRYHLKGRHFWSSYPGPRIRLHAAPGTKRWFHRYLAFRGKIVDSWINAGLFPIAPQSPSATGDYSRRFDELLALAVQADTWKRARAALALETLLTELAEERARPSITPAWLEESLSRLSAPGADLNYTEVATEAGLPERTFRRNFFRAMGMSPRDYAISSRIGHAMRMLGTTEHPIKAIAKELGYSDVFFFSRQFARVVGISPAAYRRSKQS